MESPSHPTCRTGFSNPLAAGALTLAVAVVGQWSPAQTPYLVAALPAAPANSPIDLDHAARLGDRLLFAYGGDLWCTDGTAAGTRLVSGATTGLRPVSLRALGAHVWFHAYDGNGALVLWRSDGTPAGTVPLRDAGGDYTVQCLLGAAGERTLFVAHDAAHGDELWTTIPGTDRVEIVRDIRPGPDGAIDPQSLVSTTFGELQLVMAFDGNEPGLWRSDGTPGGTVRVLQVTGGGYGPARLVPVGDRVWFPNGWPQPWFTDGATASSASVPGPNALTFASDFRPFDGRLAFWAYGVQQALWITRTGTDGFSPTLDRRTFAVGLAEHSVSLGGLLFFIALDRDQGAYELWRTDGSAAGTVRLIDSTPSARFAVDDLVVVGDLAYVSAGTLADTPGAPADHRLWVSDGTPAGTHALAAVPAHPQGARILGKRPAGARAVTFRHTVEPDDGLWISDGTEAGTVRVTTDGRSHRVHAGRLLFSVDGASLWALDLGALTEPVGEGNAFGHTAPSLHGSDPVLGAPLRLVLRDVPPLALRSVLLGLPCAPRPFGSGTFAQVELPAPIELTCRDAIAIPVPDVPALVGARVALQAAAWPTATAPFHVDVTNGLHLQLGR
ncbi:MAG: hypothetical protein IPM29_22630 [Planctomycetes bacterium]|nr:hypothetical protein [Planctomycetota bacterium]